MAPSCLAELRCVRGLADRHITAARCRHARRTIRRSVLAVRLLLGTATRLANLAVHPARVRSPRRAQTDQHHQRQHRGDENGPTSSGVHACTIHIRRARAFQNRLHALWQSERPDTSKLAQRLRVASDPLAPYVITGQGSTHIAFGAVTVAISEGARVTEQVTPRSIDARIASNAVTRWTSYRAHHARARVDASQASPRRDRRSIPG